LQNLEMDSSSVEISWLLFLSKIIISVWFVSVHSHIL
jgi:hypothetical protein